MPDPKVSLPIIVLAGPTAVGKTALALDLASRLGTEILNADSMQVYRYMDIGTAKPSAGERARIPHHLLDLVAPDEPFDAASYLECARPVIDALHARGKIPLVVGGTGLYLKVLTRGICPGAPGDPEIRRQLFQEEKERGLLRLHEELRKVDPLLAGRIHPNDRQRILRALEVFRLTGTPLSAYQAQHRFCETLYRSIKIFLSREREELYERIDRRVHQMIGEGFVDEVKRLLGRGYGPELKAMQSLGYKELVETLMGRYSLQEAIGRIQRETRRYAKRQITWFKGDPEFVWFNALEDRAVLEWVEAKLAAVS